MYLTNKTRGKIPICCLSSFCMAITKQLIVCLVILYILCSSFMIIKTPPIKFTLTNINKKEIFIDHVSIEINGQRSGKFGRIHSSIQYIIENSQNDFRLGLISDTWFHICLKPVTRNGLWYPNFPGFPKKSEITYQLDSVSQQGHLRRIYGLLYVNITSTYEFRLIANDAAIMVILRTKYSIRNITSFSGDNFEESLYVRTTDKKSEGRAKVHLKAKNIYILEIIQSAEKDGKLKLYWRTQNDQDFEIVPAEQLFHHPNMSSESFPSPIISKRKYRQRYPPSKNELIRLNFHKIPQLPDPYVERDSTKRFTCDPTSLTPRNVPKTFHGIYKMDNVLVYPKEFFNFTDNMQEKKLVLPKNEALDIVGKTVEVIQDLHGTSYELNDIVHIHTNRDPKFKAYDDWRQVYYFVELDFKDTNDGKIYRSSQFVRNGPNGLCLMKDFRTPKKVTINLLTPLKNQRIWLEFLLKELERFKDEKAEKDFNLIVLDFESTDGNITSILEASSLETQYIKIYEKNFNKVKALNKGLEFVKDNNSIVFIMDLHLQLPLNMFDRVRKLTVQGKTVFSPTLLKFRDPCEHEQYTDLSKAAIWQDDGPGIIAMYKSDWTAIGGFNEKMFSESWGGEDWELVDRILKYGLQLIHYRIPRFYHLYHPRANMWDTKS